MFQYPELTQDFCFVAPLVEQFQRNMAVAFSVVTHLINPAECADAKERHRRVAASLRKVLKGISHALVRISSVGDGSDRIGEIEALVDAARVNRYRTVMASFSSPSEWFNGPMSRALVSALMIVSGLGTCQVAGAQERGPVVVDGPKFDVPGEPSGFDRRRNRVGLPALGASNHRGRDVIAVVGTPQALIAKFTYGGTDKDLTREPVDLYVNSLGPQASAWRHFGEAVTTRNRDTVSLDGVKNDGGRVFVKPAEPLPIGRHRLVMRVRGDLSLAWIDVAIVSPNTQAVVFDIDGTLTIGDGELVTQITERLRTGEDYTPKVHAGAADVARTYAEKGYLVI
ncbi:MAG: hypothetical protein ACI9OJ_003959, partial [Myxococcota bacterium]